MLMTGKAGTAHRVIMRGYLRRAPWLSLLYIHTQQAGNPPRLHVKWTTHGPLGLKACGHCA